MPDGKQSHQILPIAPGFKQQRRKGFFYCLLFSSDPLQKQETMEKQQGYVFGCFYSIIV